MRMLKKNLGMMTREELKVCYFERVELLRKCAAMEKYDWVRVLNVELDDLSAEIETREGFWE